MLQPICLDKMIQRYKSPGGDCPLGTKKREIAFLKTVSVVKTNLVRVS